MNKYSGIELLEQLSLLVGPSGCEDKVADFILSQIDGVCDEYRTDRAANLIAKIKGKGASYDETSPRKIMISAHMDEVGVMVTDITDEGYLKFATVGGIDSRVLCGKSVLLLNEDKLCRGVIASKPIHLQSKSEREKTTPISDMYIDIGASSREEAEKNIRIGDEGVFDSDFVCFGKDKKKIKGKALDDRLGCAVMIDLMREIKRDMEDIPYDIYFAFTTCEEIGISGAAVAATGISPDLAIVLETTAVADIAGVGEASRVATQGEGGAVSYIDRSTVYDRELCDKVLDFARERGIKAQVKRYLSGGNDASHIQRSRDGVKTLALSAPSRYIHSPSNVVHRDDMEAIKKLIYALIAEAKL